jgi:hypothetical protein
MERHCRFRVLVIPNDFTGGTPCRKEWSVSDKKVPYWQAGRVLNCACREPVSQKKTTRAGSVPDGDLRLRSVQHG